MTPARFRSPIEFWYDLWSDAVRGSTATILPLKKTLLCFPVTISQPLRWRSLINLLKSLRFSSRMHSVMNVLSIPIMGLTIMEHEGIEPLTLRADGLQPSDSPTVCARSGSASKGNRTPPLCADNAASPPGNIEGRLQG